MFKALFKFFSRKDCKIHRISFSQHRVKFFSVSVKIGLLGMYLSLLYLNTNISQEQLCSLLSRA